MKQSLVLCACFLISVYSDRRDGRIHLGNEHSEGIRRGRGPEIRETVRLTYNFNSKFHFLTNEKAEVGWLIEIQTPLFYLGNGRTRAAIVINYQTGQGVYIKPGTSKLTWTSKQNFQQYVKQLQSLQPLFTEQGVKFDARAPSREVSIETQQILQPFYNTLKLTTNGAVNFVYTLVQQISVGMSTTLYGIDQVLQGPVIPTGDEIALSQNLVGLSNIFQNVGGIKALVEKGIKLDIRQVFATRSGFEVLGYLLTSLNAKMDISILFGESFSTDYACFVLLNLLSGNTYLEEGGLVNVVTQLLGYAEGKVTKEQAELVLTEVKKNENHNLSLIKLNWEASLRDFQGVWNRLKLVVKYPKVSQTLQGLIAGDLEINNVKISAILKGVFNANVKCLTL